MNKKNILVFGHLPKPYGKQSSGLSNSMWQIAISLNRLHKINFCATDIHEAEKKINNVKIYGWNKKVLFESLMSNFIENISILFKLSSLRFKYKFNFLKTFFKVIFLNQKIKDISPDYLHLHTCESVILIKINIFPIERIFLTIHGIHTQNSNKTQFIFQELLSRVRLKKIFFVSSDIKNMGRYYWKNKFRYRSCL